MSDQTYWLYVAPALALGAGLVIYFGGGWFIEWLDRRGW